ncbi:MAG: MATE family efflux transporter [Candidatus Nanoarchaeia archaeon]
MKTKNTEKMPLIENNHLDKIDNFAKNPKKALLILSYPIVIAMLVQTLYNIVDTAFVGRLGAEAIAALTFSFPLFFILIAINNGVGVGVNSRISRYLGEGKEGEAENSAIHGLLISIIFAFVVFIIGFFFLEDIFIMLGASENILKLAVSYTNIIVFGTFLMFPAYVFSSIFSAYGETKIPMKIQIIALISNIILDPIFIYYFKLGVSGAAIATVIALGFSFLLSIYYNKKKNIFRLHYRYFRFSPKIIKDIFYVGVPGSLMMIILSFYSIILNRIMADFGTNYIASIGLVFRLESLATMPLVAIASATVTLSGMFYGAKKFHLFKETTLYSMKLGVIFSFIIGGIFFAMPFIFIRIFTSNTELIKIASNYLRLDVITFPLTAIIMISARALQGIGKGTPGLVINIVRVFVVAVPLAYVFVYVFNYGYLSVAFAMISGGILASLIGILYLKKVFLEFETKK